MTLGSFHFACCARVLPALLALFATLSGGVESQPFSGKPIDIPGRFEAENFDKGGEGVAFHKIKPGNPSNYRPDPVDLENHPRSPGILCVAKVHGGEWLHYTLNVKEAGDYAVDILAGTADDEQGVFHIEFDGKDATGPLKSLKTTPGDYARLRIFVKLKAGTQIMRVCMDKDGSTGNVASFDRFVIVTRAVVDAHEQALAKQGVDEKERKEKQFQDYLKRPVDAMAVKEQLKIMAACPFRGHTETGSFLEFRHDNYDVYFLKIVEIGRAAVPVLVDALSDADPKVRVAAADCIVFLGTEETKKVAAEAMQQMWRGMTPKEAAIPLFVYSNLLHKLPIKLDPKGLNPQTCWMLMRWLSFQPIPSLEPDFIALQDDTQPTFRYAAAYYLGLHGSKAALAKARNLFDSDNDFSTRLFNALILIKHSDPRDATAATALISASDGWYIRKLAAEGLATRTSDGFLDAQKLFLEDLTTESQGDATTILFQSEYFEKLGASGTPMAMNALLYAAGNGNCAMRERVSRGLKLFDDPRAIDALNQLSDDDYPLVRPPAVEALLIAARKNVRAKECVAAIEQRRTITAFERVPLALEALVHDDFARADNWILKDPARGFQEVYSLLIFQACDHGLFRGSSVSRGAGEMLAKWAANSNMGRDQCLKNASEILPPIGDVLGEPVLEAAEKLNVDVSGKSGAKIRSYGKQLQSEQQAILGLVHSDFYLRIASAKKLTEIGTEKALAALETALTDPTFAYDLKVYFPDRPYWHGKLIDEDFYPVRVAARVAIKAIHARSKP